MIKIEGARELEKALLQLSTKSAQKVGRAALRKGASPIAKKAKQIVRKKDRRVERAVSVRVDKVQGDPSKMSAVVYVSSKKGDYRPRNTNRRSRIKGKLQPRRYDYQIGSRPDIYAKFLEYGRHKQGVRAFPFFRPAWDSEGGQVALDRIGEALGDGLEREAARLFKG